MGEKPDDNTEVGHGPLTAYVDESFNPSMPAVGNVTLSPSDGKKPELANVSELDDHLRTKDVKRLKQFLRSNNWSAQHEVRRTLWWKVCKLSLNDTSSSNIYHEQVKEVFGEGSAEHSVTLPGFVDLMSMEHYHLSEPGIHVAKRIICILGTMCPDITYAPLVFPLTSLLLHYMDEEDCYNCLYGLLHGHRGALAQTKIGHETTRFMLKDLCQKYARAWYIYVQKRGLSVDGLLSNWVWWIFRDLPFTHLVRVIDCYLLEGPKVLYRVTLAILQLFHKHVVKSSSAKMDLNIEQGLSQFCEDIPVSVDRLLKVAFGIRGLSRKEIQKLTAKAEMYMRSLRHTTMPQNLPKSDSVNDLTMRVSRSFSGPVNLQNVEASFLISEQWEKIYKWLPLRMTLLQPVLLFTTAEHGTSLKTFYDRCDGWEPTLLVIRTRNNEILGAYCSSDWTTRQGSKVTFFGTGETFVFTLGPKERKFPWVGMDKSVTVSNSAHLFMSGDNKHISIGGGSGTALQLDEDLFHGRTQRCDTFQNVPLTESTDFECTVIEAFGFESS